MCPRDAHLHHRFLHDARTRIAVAPLECDRSVTTTSTCDSRRGPRLNIAEEPPLVSKATRMREGSRLLLLCAKSRPWSTAFDRRSESL